MAPRFSSCWRLLVAGLVALSVVAMAPGSALAERITVTGTIHSIKDDGMIILNTDSLGVRNQPITIDVGKQLLRVYRTLDTNQPITLVIEPREHNSYLAVAFVEEGSATRGSDLGVKEVFETQNSSINSHVGNVPQDDEALAQQHRNNNLKRDEDDD